MLFFLPVSDNQEICISLKYQKRFAEHVFSNVQWLLSISHSRKFSIDIVSSIHARYDEVYLQKYIDTMSSAHSTESRQLRTDIVQYSNTLIELSPDLEDTAHLLMFLPRTTFSIYSPS